MAHGHDNWVDDIVDDKISISDYPLSAAVTCSKLVYLVSLSLTLIIFRLLLLKICGECCNRHRSYDDT